MSDPTPIIDSHCHLWWSRFDDDRAEVLARARARGVVRQVVVGTTAETSRLALEMCSQEPDLHPTAGIHPHDAAQADDAATAEIERLCRLPECVAVGETGLDYFRNHSGRREQLDLFHWHLDLARRIDKPVVIHCRDSHEDVARSVAEFPGLRGVMHCYSYGPEELEPYLAAGLHISFSGVVTYPKNDGNRAAARAVPVDRLLIETDCPFLAPQTQRGQRNEPAFVRDVLELISEERGADSAELAAQTHKNTVALFALPETDQ